MENEKDYTEIDLVEVFYVIKDNARNIFVVTLCCVLIAAAYVFWQSRAAIGYESQALVRVQQMPVIIQAKGLQESTSNDDMKSAFSATPLSGSMNGEAQSVFSLGYAPLDLNQRFLTYAEILKSKAIMNVVNEELGINGLVKVAQIKDTEMMTISFMADSAEKAQKGNEILIKAFQNYIAQKEQTKTPYKVNNLDTQKSGENAEIVVIASPVNIEIVNPPTLPGSVATVGNPKRTLAISVLFGILFGSGYAVMHYLMNRKITTRQDIEDYLGLPVLAVVPEEKSLAEAMARQNDESVLQKIGGLLWKEQN